MWDHIPIKCLSLHLLVMPQEEAQLGPEQIDALYQYAKFQFDCGNYSSAAELLQVGVLGSQRHAGGCRRGCAGWGCAGSWGVGGCSGRGQRLRAVHAQHRSSCCGEEGGQVVYCAPRCRRLLPVAAAASWGGGMAACACTHPYPLPSTFSQSSLNMHTPASPQAYKPLCTSSERNMNVLWGKLAADTLMQNYDAATEDLQRLRESLDNQSFGVPPLVLLQQRTWLMHWSLHVYWNHENGRNALVDLFMQPPYMAAIQINAQHLLRYLAAAVLVNKRRRNQLKELVRLIQVEAYEYSDPITQVGV